MGSSLHTHEFTHKHTHTHDWCLSSGMGLDLYTLICLKLPNAAFFVLSLIPPSIKAHFSKACWCFLYSCINKYTPAFVPWNAFSSGIIHHPSGKHAAELRQCIPAAHLRSSEPPVDKCFLYSPLSCINEYTGSRLILMIHYINILSVHCISHLGQSRYSSSRLWDFD